MTVGAIHKQKIPKKKMSRRTGRSNGNNANSSGGNKENQQTVNKVTDEHIQKICEECLAECTNRATRQLEELKKDLVGQLTKAEEETKEKLDKLAEALSKLIREKEDARKPGGSTGNKGIYRSKEEMMKDERQVKVIMDA